jgi:hypothetical protein
MKRISPKLIGEWVELKFMARAADEGLTVSKPYGDSAPFDFIVGRHQPLHRVQVRGTSVLKNRGVACYLAHCRKHRNFDHKLYDFLAVYIMTHKQWYLIPTKAIARNRWTVTLFPAHNSKSKYEKYRDAWHLLRQGPKHKFLRAMAATQQHAKRNR